MAITRRAALVVFLVDLFVENNMDVLKPKKNKKFAQIGIGMFALLCILCLWLSAPETTPTLEMSDLRISLVKLEPFNIEVVATGTLNTVESGSIVSPEGGIVIKRHVSNGDLVKEGALLFELENIDLVSKYSETRDEYFAKKSQIEYERFNLKREVAENKLRLKKAELEYKNKEMELKAKRELFETPNPIISKLDFERIKMEHELTKNNYELEGDLQKAFLNSTKAKEDEFRYVLSSFENKLKKMEYSVGSLKVKAPYDGVVQEITVDQGSRVEPMTLLCRVPSEKILYVSAKVASYEVNKIRNGQAVQVYINNEIYSGKVFRIDPLVVDSMVNVDISLNDLIASHKVNTQVRVVISVDSKAEALTIDRPANVKENTKQFLYVLKNGQARKKEVELGMASISKIEVISGLSVNDEVVVSDISDESKGVDLVRIK